MGMDQKRRYTAEERAKALAMAEGASLGAVSKVLNIPVTTISGWRSLVRRQGQAASEVQPECEPVKLAPSGAGVGAAQADAQPANAKNAVRVARVYTPSQRAQALEYAAIEGLTAAARKYGISRFALYDWRRRSALEAEGKAEWGMSVRDRDETAALDQCILAEWRAHPGLGPSQVRNQLRRQGKKVSLHTVRVVLEANGYVSPRVRRVAVHDQRYEAVRPNHLWHLDFLHRYVHKQKVYLLLVVDDFSRFIVGAALWDGERVAAVQETFLAAVSRYGKPEKAMSDGGSAFYAWRGVGAFTRLLDELEVDQLIATTPQTNGKLEVLNANVQKELFNQETFLDLGEAQRRLSAWVSFYNFRRTHHALGGLLVPADRYFGRADEVLACVEAGRSPNGVGEPISVGERQLDLFRVTSHRGQVELHLLGTRIVLPPHKGVGPG
ncbi:MAG: DDE-type integrase/transposase/recombinase [Armatimonadetes bacterium]|nr:DDE-type integrase/transposase/recombinase [Armatimonadota bacterium]